MSDTPHQPSSPGSNRPKPTKTTAEMSESDLWDLGDILDKPSPSSSASPAPEIKAPPAVEAVKTAPAVPPAATTVAPAAPSTPQPAVVAPEPAPSAAATPAGSKSPSLTAILPKSKADRFGLAVSAIVLIGIGIWAFSAFSSGVATTHLGADQPDMPAKGRFAEIDKAETFWMKANEGGEETMDVPMMPIVRVYLDKAESGVIRVTFRDDTGEFVGDNVTLAFSGGRFASTGEKSANFTATSGFEQLSDFNQYRVGKARWTADVLEGPSTDAPGSEFVKLFTIPISAESR